MPRLASPLFLTCACATALPSVATAGETYGAVGFPGVLGGYAHEVSEALVLRVDAAALRPRNRDGEHEGIDYKGTIRAMRLGAFVDYFLPGASGFRLTSGITINHMSLKLRSAFTSGAVTVGGATVPVSQQDYFNVDIRFPRVTPYLGVGWGHRRREPGWGFVADLGASIGKPRVEVDTNLRERGVSDADIDAETRQLRDDTGRIRVVPQITVGMSYRY